MKQNGPTYLFSQHKNDLFNIENKILRAPTIFLFLDYDGTLTPIRKKPSEAVLSSAAKDILKQLSSLPDIRVSIVTGRSMKIIRRLIPLKTIEFAANHGLHIRYKDGSEWIHLNALASIRMLTKARSRLRIALKSFPKAIVEDKKLTLSVHYRNCTPGQFSSLKNVVTNIICSVDPSLRITKGKKVLEVRPQTIWGKREAVLELLKGSKSNKHPLTIFIGDDTTDEEAFQVLRSVGITVRVGKSLNTAATYYVKDVREVLHFLKLILMIRTQ